MKSPLRVLKHSRLRSHVMFTWSRALELVDTWREAGAHDTDVSLQTQRLTLDVVGLTAFSHDFGETAQTRRQAQTPPPPPLVTNDSAIVLAGISGSMLSLDVVQTRKCRLLRVRHQTVDCILQRFAECKAQGIPHSICATHLGAASLNRPHPSKHMLTQTAPDAVMGRLVLIPVQTERRSGVTGPISAPCAASWLGRGRRRRTPSCGPSTPSAPSWPRWLV